MQIESRYTPFGRLRDRGSISALMGLVKDDKLNQIDVAEINETGMPTYPLAVGPIYWLLGLAGDRQPRGPGGHSHPSPELLAADSLCAERTGEGTDWKTVTRGYSHP